jgi:hypothetical protein
MKILYIKDDAVVQYTGANIAGKKHFGHWHDAKQCQMGIVSQINQSFLNKIPNMF